MLAHYFPPLSTIGATIRVTKFVRHLPRISRWRPVVLTLEDRSDYSFLPRSSDLLLNQIPPETRVLRCPTLAPRSLRLGRALRPGPDKNRPGSPKLRALNRLRTLLQNYIFIPDLHLTWLPFALPAALKAVKSQKIHLIYATSPPASTILLAAWLKRWTGLPLVLDFRDDWVGKPWPAMGTANSRPAIRLQKRLERRIVRQADRIVTATEWSLRAFRSRYPDLDPDKLVLIPNGWDPEDHQGPPLPRPASRNGSFNLIYGGSLGPTRPVSPLFEAIGNLSRTNSGMAPDLALNFVGDLSSTCSQEAARFGLSQMVKEIPALSPSRFAEIIRGADLLLAIADPGRPTCLPGKIYEYWAAGGPPILLLAEDGAAKELVEKHGLGVVVPPGDPVRISKAISRLYRKWKAGELKPLPQAGLSQYDRRSLAQGLARVFDQALDQGRRR